MDILLIDVNPSTHSQLLSCMETAYPQDSIYDFTDPLLALKFGSNNPVDLLVVVLRMRIAMGQDIARILKRSHPNMRSIYVIDGPRRRQQVIEPMPDAIIHCPVTAEKLKRIITNRG